MFVSTGSPGPPASPSATTVSAKAGYGVCTTMPLLAGFPSLCGASAAIRLRETREGCDYISVVPLVDSENLVAVRPD